MQRVNEWIGPRKRMRQHRLNCLLDESGSVLIETAGSFMLVMAMVLGIVECCTMAYTYGVLSEAARNAVRYATVHGTDSTNCSGPSAGCTDSTAANVSNQVTDFAAAFLQNTSGITVNVSYPDASGSAPPSRVIVSLSYTYQPLFSLFAMHPTFQVSDEGRIVY